jgi:hypothetical protein
MWQTEIGPQTLIEELNGYLTNSRLSLGQIALRLDISKGHLSEIKNGKARPALNTGLKILKMCGFDKVKRQAWAHFYNMEVSCEYQDVFEEFDKEEILQLNERLSFILARDSELLNAYVDIVNSEEDGMSATYLKTEYGRGIIDKLNILVDEKVLQNRGGLYATGTVDPIMTKNASYDLVKGFFDQQQLDFQKGELDGKFKFEINDITPEGRAQLVELFKRTMNKATEIMEQNKLPRYNGGTRYIFQAMAGKIKTVFIFLSLLFTAMAVSGLPNTYAMLGGGISGGSSDDSSIIQRYHELHIDNYFNLSITDVLLEEADHFSNPHMVFDNNLVDISALCYNHQTSEVISQYNSIIMPVEEIRVECLSIPNIRVRDCDNKEVFILTTAIGEGANKSLLLNGLLSATVASFKTTSSTIDFIEDNNNINAVLEEVIPSCH